MAGIASVSTLARPEAALAFRNPGRNEHVMWTLFQLIGAEMGFDGTELWEWALTKGKEKRDVK
jgi:hypothetical protein